MFKTLPFLLAILVQLLSFDCVIGDDLPEALRDAQAERVRVIAEAKKTAVCIFGPQSRGGGSGVVISKDGYALSNYHVVQSCGPFMKCSMADGVLYDAVIVGIDPVGDVALVKLLGRDDFPAARMGDSDLTEQGDYCFAVGNPFLLATDFQPTVTWGIVSGTNRYQYPSGTMLEYADCIQTDASINPGNSGGPLFNASGELIGINGRGSFEKRGRVNVGVGYAISINQIKLFLDHLKSGRIVDHATIGATVATNDDNSVRVSNILESSQAFRRGLDYDDEILEFAGREIQTVNQFKNVLGIFPKGYRVPLKFRREGQESVIQLRMTGVHAAEELVELIEGKSETPEQEPEQESAESGEGFGAPKGYENLYRQRSGFANYQFNVLNRERVWKQFLNHGNFGNAKFGWRLTGKNAQGDEVSIVLGDEQSGFRQPSGSFVLELEQDLSQQLGPTNSGGLLVALHLWRKMLVHGPEKFGDVVYLGSVPNPLDQKLNDVLVATTGTIESNLLFDQQSGQLRSFEMYPDSESDPCEVYFGNYQVDNELTVPGTISFRHGTGELQTIQIEQIEFLE